jgi:hypothetical protein
MGRPQSAAAAPSLGMSSWGAPSAPKDPTSPTCPGLLISSTHTKVGARSSRVLCERAGILNFLSYPRFGNQIWLWVSHHIPRNWTWLAPFRFPEVTATEGAPSLAEFARRGNHGRENLGRTWGPDGAVHPFVPASSTITEGVILLLILSARAFWYKTRLGIRSSLSASC